jgi:hypothetical protein
LQISIDHKSDVDIKYTQRIIGKMKNGEKIWLQEEYINN